MDLLYFHLEIFIMMVKKKLLNLILTFCLILSLGVSASGNAIAGSPPSFKVVRVGFPIQEGLTMKDENGNYSGYTYDYLQEIAQYTGWEYEFVEVPGEIDESLSTMLTMLENGELDIMGAMSKTEDTERRYDFPEYSYGSSYRTLCVPEENTSINASNYHTIKGLKVAVYKNGSVGKSKLESFFELNNVDYQFIEVTTLEEMLQAVKDGRADAMVSNNLNPVEGFRTIAQYSGSQFYFGVTKGNTDILSQLNSTILTIQQAKPLFDSSLYKKYFLSESDELFLTVSEQNFINTADPIKIIMIKSIPPIQFADEQGAVKGISKDILELISSETGLKFEYITAKNYNEAFELLDSGEADAVCGIPYDYDLALNYGYVMSNTFLSAQTMLIIKNGQTENLEGKTIGIVDKAEQYDSGNKTILFDNVSDCMDAVSSGKVDGAYVNLYSAEYLSYHTQYKDLRLIPQSNETTDFCFGIKKTQNTSIVSILNKVLASIPASDLETIIYQNTSRPAGSYTLSEFISNNPFLSLGMLTVFFIAVVAVVLWIMRIRIRAEKKLKIENKRYAMLSELANEYIYEYNFNDDTLMFSKEFSRLFSLPDRISNFKDISNTNNGTPYNPVILGIFRDIINDGDNSDFEKLCLLPKGEQRWYHVTRAVIGDSNGKSSYIIGKFIDVQSEKEVKDHLEKQILIDGLTGIYNSMAMKNIIGERLGSLSKTAALLIIDIDKFKDVNDLLGHYTGDLVLKDFAEMLSATIGNWDIAGRLGGDEFIVYMESPESLEKLESLCSTILVNAGREYIGENGDSLTITVSIGAVLINRKCTFAEIYRVADKELYESKNNGRNRYTIIEYP